MSTLISPEAEAEAEAEAIALKALWSENWQGVTDNEKLTQQLISQVDKVRFSINAVLKHLQ